MLVLKVWAGTVLIVTGTPTAELPSAENAWMITSASPLAITVAGGANMVRPITGVAVAALALGQEMASETSR